MIRNLNDHPSLLLAIAVTVILAMCRSDPVLAEDPGLVLAFYYAWYDQNTWSSGTPADQPVQPYASDDLVSIERHVKQARASGIDAFIQSWYGPQQENNQTESNFRTLLDVAAANDFRAAADLETTSPFLSEPASVANAIDYLLRTHAQHPSYLHYQGKPVIFFWRQQRFSVDDWATIREQVDPNHISLWIAEGVDISYQAVFDGHHLYSIAWSPDVSSTLSDWGSRVRRYASQYGLSRLWIATVMPGYDDTGTGRTDSFAVERRAGDYYRETWSAAVASQPDWIVITSFNEWIEGTMIEPSLSYGDLYLDLTRELATAYKSSRPQPAVGTLHLLDNNEMGSERAHEQTETLPSEPYLRANEALRVRSGPGTDYPRVGRLSPGETAPVEGRTADGAWWQIEYLPAASGLGWVTAQFVTFQGRAASVPVVTSALVTPTRSPTPLARATSLPSPTPTPARTRVPTATPTLTPTASPSASATTAPSSTPTVSPTTSSTATPASTPMLRAAPVAQRRPANLLWVTAGAWTVAVVLGAWLFWSIRTRR